MYYPQTSPYPSRLPFSPVPTHRVDEYTERPSDELRNDLVVDVMVSVRYRASEDLERIASRARLWSELGRAALYRYACERTAGTTVDRGRIHPGAAMTDDEIDAHVAAGRPSPRPRRGS